MPLPLQPVEPALPGVGREGCDKQRLNTDRHYILHE